MDRDLIRKYLATNPEIPDGLLKALEVRALAWADKNKECLEAKKVQLEAQLKTVSDKLTAMTAEVKP
jgi:hypothetical protein